MVFETNIPYFHIPNLLPKLTKTKPTSTIPIGGKAMVIAIAAIKSMAQKMVLNAPASEDKHTNSSVTIIIIHPKVIASCHLTTIFLPDRLISATSIEFYK